MGLAQVGVEAGGRPGGGRSWAGCPLLLSRKTVLLQHSSEEAGVLFKPLARGAAVALTRRLGYMLLSLSDNFTQTILLLDISHENAPAQHRSVALRCGWSSIVGSFRLSPANKKPHDGDSRHAWASRCEVCHLILSRSSSSGLVMHDG